MFKWRIHWYLSWMFTYWLYIFVAWLLGPPPHVPASIQWGMAAIFVNLILGLIYDFRLSCAESERRFQEYIDSCTTIR